MPTAIRLKRAYDEPACGDGRRVLVDRVWPRGVTKEAAALDDWCKDIAPSSELRKWFGHDPERFAEFTRRYREELKDNTDAARALLDAVGDGPLTLVYGARDEQHNHAVVLRDFLKGLA